MFNGCSCSSLSCSQGALEVEPGQLRGDSELLERPGQVCFPTEFFVWNFRMLWKVAFVSFHWQITWIYTPPHRITNHHRDVVRFLGVGNPKLNLKKKLLEWWIQQITVDFQRFFSAWLFETYPISPWKLLLGRGDFSFAIWQMVPSCGCILHFFWVGYLDRPDFLGAEAYRQAKEKLRQSQGGFFESHIWGRNCGCE